MTTLNIWKFAILYFATTALACNTEERNPQLSTKSTLNQDLTAINSTRNNYMSAWKAGKADLLSNFYTDDGLVLYPNQPEVKGKTEIHSYFREFFNHYLQDSFELKSQEIEIAGVWAFDRGTYRLKATPRNGGDAIDDNGKYLVILQRQGDGSWKVARDMDNSDRKLSQITMGNK